MTNDESRKLGEEVAEEVLAWCRGRLEDQGPRRAAQILFSLAGRLLALAERYNALAAGAEQGRKPDSANGGPEGGWNGFASG